MRILLNILAQLLVMSCTLMAQSPNSPVATPQSELGKWWKNSETVKKLQLSEAQVNQIEQIFLDHRMALSNLNSELKIHEEELKKLMQADPVNDAVVRAQTERVLSARIELQRENSSMMLSIRKALSREQWEKLEGAKKPAPYVPGNGIKPPKVLYRPLPAYTQEARENRIQGLILLQAIVRKDGTVDSFKIIKGLGYGLDQSAIDTIAKQWRFEPGARLDGEPVDAEVNIEVSFWLGLR